MTKFIIILYLKYLILLLKSRILDIYITTDKIREIVIVVQGGKQEAKDIFMDFLKDSHPDIYKYVKGN